MASSHNDSPMSKRERFAGMAMQGLLAANALYDGRSDNRDRLAGDAVAHADALIEALNGGLATVREDITDELVDALRLAEPVIAFSLSYYGSDDANEALQAVRDALAKASGSQAQAQA